LYEPTFWRNLAPPSSGSHAVTSQKTPFFMVLFLVCCFCECSPCYLLLSCFISCCKSMLFLDFSAHFLTRFFWLQLWFTFYNSRKQACFWFTSSVDASKLRFDQFDISSIGF
jgi:hypothetical protein